MNILKLMTYLFSKMKSGLLKKHICLLFACVMGLFLISSSFTSCAPGLDDQGSGSTDGGSDDDDDDDDDDDETRNTECEADGDDDLCKDDESCVRVCEHIYEDHEEVKECKDRDEVRVGRMDKVHNLLIEKFDSAHDLESNLDSISEGDGDDVDKEDLVCYLEISGEKWITAIKDGLKGGDDDKKIAQLETVLDWVVKNEKIAEILKDDIDDGDDILEALLLELASLDRNNRNNACIEDVSIESNVGPTTSINIWLLDSGKNMMVKFVKENTPDEGTITLDTNDDRDLYNALSCVFPNKGSGIRNVFSYSAEEGNQHVFDMAFELLNKVCDDVTNKSTDQDKACARALMCWTASKQNSDNTGDNGAPVSGAPNTKFWEMVENHESNLENGNSNYNSCNAEHFA